MSRIEHGLRIKRGDTAETVEAMLPKDRRLSPNARKLFDAVKALALEGHKWSNRFETDRFEDSYAFYLDGKIKEGDISRDYIIVQSTLVKDSLFSRRKRLYVPNSVNVHLLNANTGATIEVSEVVYPEADPESEYHDRLTRVRKTRPTSEHIGSDPETTETVDRVILQALALLPQRKQK